MTRIVFITQHVDPEHPALAATIPKLQALARIVDEVVVLALGARPGALPPNCRVHVFGGPSRLVRTLRYVAALARALHGDHPAAVVVHMVPVYAILAAPLVRPRRVPLLLWFTHWKATPALRLAERVVTGVVSVDLRSFPLPSRKVTAIGHGIDLAEFDCRATPPRAKSLRVLALGRYSPSKGYETVLRAIGIMLERDSPAVLRVVGPALTQEEREHRRALERLRSELGLDEFVSLEDSVPRSRVPELLAETDVLVNNMREGAPDKVVYEAAACCVPVIASNPVFDELFSEELRFGRDRPEELAESLQAVGALDGHELEALVRSHRDRVAAGHTTESWAAGLLAAAIRR
jgi:glycosyltransferase involved in cell wall biosynthesis